MFKVKQPKFQSFKTFNRCAPFKSLNNEHGHVCGILQNVEMIGARVANLLNL